MDNGMKLTRKKFITICLALISFMLLMYYYYKVRQIQITDISIYGILFFIASYCLVKGLMMNYLINPYLLFTILPISMLMYDLSVSTHYLVELSTDTYFLAIYNFIMIVIGFNMAYILKFPYGSIWNKSINFSRKSLSKQAIRIMLLGLIPTFYGCVFGLQYLLSFNLHAMKGVVNSAPLASVFSLFLYLGILCALASKQKKTIVICFGALLFSLILNFSKTTVVMMCISILIYCYDITKINNRAKKLFVILVCVALGLTFASFTIYNNIRFDYNINEYFDDLGYIGNVSITWFLPLMYVISPWSNLQYIIETTTNYSTGLWVLKPILSYLQIDSLWSGAFELVPRFTAFNTYTFISVYYRDFGFWGSGICSFVLGIYIMYIFKLKQRFCDSPHVTAIFALNMYATVMMFFNNHFQQLSYPFTIFIITWIWIRFFAGK